MNNKKAFTLVELLIVIVVLGILAAMMMFSSTEAVTTAKANNIITGLDTLRKAALSWYADNKHCVRTKENEGQTYWIYYHDGSDANFEGFARKHSKDILKYDEHNRSIKLTTNGNGKLDSGQFCFSIADGTKKKSNIWYVGYKFKDSESKIKEKISGRATKLGLIGGGGDSWPKPTKDKTFTAEDNIVWMYIMTNGE